MSKLRGGTRDPHKGSKIARLTGGAVATTVALGLIASTPALAYLPEAPEHGKGSPAGSTTDVIHPDSSVLDTAIESAKSKGLTVQESAPETVSVDKNTLASKKTEAESDYAAQAQSIHDGITKYEQDEKAYQEALRAHNNLVDSQTVTADPQIAAQNIAQLAVEQPFKISGNRSAIERPAGWAVASPGQAIKDPDTGKIVVDNGVLGYSSDSQYVLVKKGINPNASYTFHWNDVAVDTASGRKLDAQIVLSDFIIGGGGDGVDASHDLQVPLIAAYSNFSDNFVINGITSVKQTLTYTYSDDGTNYDKRYYTTFGSLNAQGKSGQRYEFAAPGNGVIASFLHTDSSIYPRSQAVSGTGAQGTPRAFMVRQGGSEPSSGVGDVTPGALERIGVTFLVNNGASYTTGISGSNGNEPQPVYPSDSVHGTGVRATYNHIMLSTATVAPTAIPPVEPVKPVFTVKKVSLEISVPGTVKEADDAGKTVLPGQSTTQRVTANTGASGALKSFAIGDNIYLTKDGRNPVKVDQADLHVTNGSGADVTDQFTITTGLTDADGEPVFQILAVAKEPASLSDMESYTLHVKQTALDDGFADKETDSGFSIRNGDLQYTERFEYPEPNVEPHKYDTAPNTFENIDTKNVVRGDTIQYVIVNDTSELVNTVAPLTTQGIVDHYDTKNGTVDPSTVKVYQLPGSTTADLSTVAGLLQAAPKDVTASFTITDNKDEGLSVMMKNENGALVLPMGFKYIVVMPYTVTATEAVTIPNQALQINNDWKVKTERVTNPTVPLKPTKDVVATIGGPSINGKVVAMNDSIYYDLNSSTRPASYAGTTTSWTIYDDYNEEFDQYGGVFTVTARHDFVGEGGTVKAGSDITSYFTQSIDKTKGAVTYKASPEFLKLMNSAANRSTEQGWTVHMQVKRIKPATEVVNSFTETFNGYDLDSNKVTTSTPVNPSVSTGGTPKDEGVPYAPILAGGTALALLVGGAVFLIRRARVKAQNKN